MALCMAALAWRRSRVAGGFYDADVYAMTTHSHRVYAAVFLGFSVVFSLAIATRLQSLGIAALAVLALAAVFYGTSFLRGASDADE